MSDAENDAPPGGDPGGGDPACWAHLVCPECGMWLGEADRRQGTCPDCDADLGG